MWPDWFFIATPWNVQRPQQFVLFCDINALPSVDVDQLTFILLVVLIGKSGRLTLDTQQNRHQWLLCGCSHLGSSHIYTAKHATMLRRMLSPMAILSCVHCTLSLSFICLCVSDDSPCEPPPWLTAASWPWAQPAVCWWTPPSVIRG